MSRKTPTEARMSVPASAEPAAAPVAADQAAAKPYPLPVDEFHGLGGSYEMVDGVRRRLQGPALDR